MNVFFVQTETFTYIDNIMYEQSIKGMTTNVSNYRLGCRLYAYMWYTKELILKRKSDSFVKQ